MKMRSAHRRGFSLVELMIASALSAIVSLAAVAFIAHQTKLIGATSEVIELGQASRFGLDRLASDLRHAGLGVGYDESGAFRGFERGNFTRGAAAFTSNNRSINLAGGAVATDDLGLVFADGGYTTITSYNAAGSMQVCRGSRVTTGDTVLLRSEDGISARTVRVDSINAAACLDAVCVGGCETWGFSADPGYTSGPSAVQAAYEGGEAAGNFRRVTWFVDDTDPARPGQGRLRRAEGNCATRDASCGELMADGVESLQVRVLEWNGTTWLDITNTAPPLVTSNRLRVDVELVVAGRHANLDRPHAPEASALEDNLCFPACGTAGDGRARRVVNTSVELRNSGRMTFRRAR
jgi:prepilin-type N-terminal cleavage/methylation domain-containing protein